MNHESNPPESKPHDTPLGKRRTGDALIYLAAAVGFIVMGILAEILRRMTDSLDNSPMDLFSPFMMIVGIFLSIVGLVKLIRADQASHIP